MTTEREIQPKQPDISIRRATAPNPSAHTSDSGTNQDDDNAGGKKRKSTTGTKRRKVNHACLYCRRSHMTCDEGRPCQRCIKREIGHLCHDERKPSQKDKDKMTEPASSVDESSLTSLKAYQSIPFNASQIRPPSNMAWFPEATPQTAFMYQAETSLGNEFSVLSDFLESLDERSFFNPPPTTVTPALMSGTQSFSDASDPNDVQHVGAFTDAPENMALDTPIQSEQAAQIKEETVPIVLPAANKTEKFLLTAADQEPGTRNDRLNRVIRSKYEAGLLKPYNYVKGYARLSRWMDSNVSQESKQKILQPLSVLRPKFRAIAQSLTDIDLVFIEEAFERLLLDYDRVFSAMAVPACLWRRTGEIYKGNREFAELVGLDGYMLRDGRSCIYELMAEESAVNYWEKYGTVAFDSHQKAVLTTCVLRVKPDIVPSPMTLASKGQMQRPPPKEEGFVSCCFSFTIRRDAWGIPSMIVGNFIKC